MVSNTVQDNFISVLVFVFVILTGLGVSSVLFNNYGIVGDTGLSQYQNDTDLTNNLKTLGYDIENADQTAKVSSTDFLNNPIGLVASVLIKLKSVRNISGDIIKITQGYLDFVPSLVWWFLSLIIAIIFVIAGLTAYFGRGIKQE
jgi:hypothetical protein